MTDATIANASGAPCPALSTYCSDPDATHTVASITPDGRGGGIDGYYTNELDAHRVARWLRDKGHRHVKVEPYDPLAEPEPGIHPLALAVAGIAPGF